MSDTPNAAGANKSNNPNTSELGASVIGNPAPPENANVTKPAPKIRTPRKPKAAATSTPDLAHAKYTERTVAIADLTFDPDIHKESSAKRIKQLANGMKAGKPRHATTIGVVKAIVHNDALVVFAGGTEMLARKQLKETHILVRVYDFTPEQAVEMRRFNDLNRGPVNSLDLVGFVTDYVGWDDNSKKAQAFLGKKKSQVCALKKLSEADPVILAAIDQGAFSTSHGLKLMERKGTHADLDLTHWINRVNAEKLGVRKMLLAIDAHFGVVTDKKPAAAVDAQTPAQDAPGNSGSVNAWTAEEEAEARTLVLKQLERFADTKITFQNREYDLRTFAETYPNEVGMVLFMLTDDLEEMDDVSEEKNSDGDEPVGDANGGAID